MAKDRTSDDIFRDLPQSTVFEGGGRQPVILLADLAKSADCFW